MRELWRYYKNSPLIWSTHWVSIIIALFAPSNVLSELPLLCQAVDAIATVFPVIRNYGKQSPFTEVTELYFSWMILMGPLWCWTLARNREMKDSVATWYAALSQERYVFLRAVGLLALCLPLAWFGLFIDPGYDFHLAPVNSSRLALAMWGPVFAQAPFWMLAVSGAMLKGAITRI